MKTKLIIAATLSLACSVVSAQTIAQKEVMIHKAFASEGRCIGLAELAEGYARASSAGIPKVEVVKIANKHSTDWGNRVAKNILSLVYMMQLDEQMAAQLVYGKCMVGDYNPTVEEVEEGMRKK